VCGGGGGEWRAALPLPHHRPALLHPRR
jgi:hypothetical protein